MKTIERNYRRNPHTANFLMTFHQAAYGLPSEVNAPEIDLLDTVDVAAPVDVRTQPQRDLMDKLVGQITDLDAELGARTAKYVADKSAAGAWVSPRRDGDVSAWITKMIEKVRELKAGAPAPVAAPATGDEADIPAHYYGIHHEGEVKCYQVDYGKEGTRWAGYTFLSRVSSDDRFPIKNPEEKARILAAIRDMGVEASQILAGQTMSRCRRCGRGLSDTKNPYLPLALGPDCGAM